MPLNLISQLAHVEILSPRPEETLRFMTEIVGLTETGRDGESWYLRGWGEHYVHSLQVTRGQSPGLGHVGWRAFGAEELERAVERLEASGNGIGWINAGFGHGPAYRYRGPGGHLQEIFWEVERYVAPSDMISTYPSRPQRFAPRGIAARNIDHVTLSSGAIMADVEWYRRTLGHRFMEYTVSEDDPDFVVFAMTTTCERAHDMGFVIDPSTKLGRMHHLAYWVDSRDELVRAADVLIDAGAAIEFGPGRHGHGEQDYLYFREPGGMRFEINTGGYRNHEPDWEVRRWTPSQGSNAMYRNVTAPLSMMESFPTQYVEADTRVVKSTLFV